MPYKSFIEAPKIRFNSIWFSHAFSSFNEISEKFVTKKTFRLNTRRLNLQNYQFQIQITKTKLQSAAQVCRI